MKLLLWIGNEPNQKALANKLAEEFNVIGIVTESRKQNRKITVKRLFDSLYERIFLSPMNKAWWGMKNYYEQKYIEYPDVKHIDVENINKEEAYNFSRELNPDLIIVSGTRIVKNKMLSINAKQGILNLHTGLSPYIKGGPNCTNWCIATKQYHLVGNTIMWIDEGIDSGNIVTTEHTEIEWSESLLDIHIAVMEHAHELYKKAIRFISLGGKSNVSQSELGKGKTYYSKDWKLKNKKELIQNLNKIQCDTFKDEIENKRKDIKTVGITLGNKI
jgi:methionyl-tRNA formyltransferase